MYTFTKLDSRTSLNTLVDISYLTHQEDRIKGGMKKDASKNYIQVGLGDVHLLCQTFERLRQEDYLSPISYTQEFGTDLGTIRVCPLY